MKKKVSFMDIGTNSCKADTIEIDINTKKYTTIESFRILTRLGKNYNNDRKLCNESIDRTVYSIKKLQLLLSGEKIYAVATSAVRDAENKEDFIKEVHKKTGIKVKIISEKKEAYLIYLGIISTLDLGINNGMFIDIGGGSTEIMAGNKHKCLYSESFKTGAIRIYEKFFTQNSNEIDSKEYETVIEYVKSKTKNACDNINSLNAKYLIGSSGTITNLGEITKVRTENYSVLNKYSYEINIKDLKETINILCSLTLEERKKNHGIRPERADIIVPGAAVLDAIIQNTQFESIIITALSLKEGLIANYMKIYDIKKENQNK